MNKIAFSIFLIVCFSSASAQDEFDALRYSQTNYQSTARSQSLGGASGSMGGDFSCLSVNPAGLGIYKSSEFMFTPSLVVASTRTNYLNGELSASETKFNFSNFGIIVTQNLPQKNNKPQNWRTFSFGAGMNRSATYKNEYRYTGTNFKNSITEKFADDFNALGGINDYSLSMVNYQALAAYETYLIDRGLGIDSDKAVTYVPFEDGIQQTKSVSESGRMTEYVISVGGNYMDKLLIGATLGIIDLKYERVTNFNEVDISGDLNNDFKYMALRDQLNTKGTGLNFKIGAIYKPTSQLRIGFAIHTPTHIELNDVSFCSMESHTDSLFLQQNPFANPVKKYFQDSALIFNYSLNTPFKSVLSACYLFGKLGLLTADLEYTDYGSMRYNYGLSYEEDSRSINQIIRDTYRDALSVRIGGEVRLNKLSLRVGFAHVGSAFKNNSFNNQKTNGSIGIGYRSKYWFTDLVVIYGTQQNTELPYSISRASANVEAASITTHNVITALTLGIKF